ncbi:MAG: DUF4230 domain-containing protein [Muribaculaceae bacterium]|nr:DUF4230 domain-containing protein [Muribaculaceae bacterium]
MKVFRKYILLLIVVAVACVALWWWLSRPVADDGMRTREARIQSITDMIELCTLDIHDEITIKDSIHGKWIVARQTIEGRVRFDLDSIKVAEKGDTLVITLPQERVDILENAGADSYEVLDTWDGSRSLFPRTVTAAEENAIKRRWQAKARERIYRRGYVKQAREEAKSTLQSFFGALGVPVIILDPLPAPRTVE